MGASRQLRGVTIDQLLAALIQGVNTSFPAGSSVVIEGVSYDKGTLEQKLQAVNAPYVQVDDLRTRLATALKARTAAEPATREFLEKLVVGLVYLFGTDPNLLAKFGIQPPKERRKLTVEEKLARAAKSRATRKLRSTRGARQKQGLRVQGDVAVNVVVPGMDEAGSTSSASSSSTSNGVTASQNGATGPQEANGAAH